jgi:hypothetical protein
MTVHPFTYDLPRGGRHVSPRAVAPIASLRTRVNQLMPVGLLVVATSTAVAVALPHDDSSVASGDAHRSLAAPQHRPVGVVTGGTTASAVGHVADQTRSHLAADATDPAAATLTMAGKHRAAGVADAGTTSTTTGKHRLAPTPKHTTRADPQQKPDPEPAAMPSAAAASGSAAAPSTAPSPDGGGLSTTTGLVGGVLGGVLDGVGGLLGAPAS